MTERRKRYEVESHENWDKHYHDMPYISLREGYSIRVVPPSGGAMLRFRIKRHDKEYSVYYDTNDVLGSVGHPYYEACAIEGDTYRSTNMYDIMMQIYIDSEGTEAIKKDYPEYFV